MCSSRAERSLQTRQRGPGHDDEALGALERCAAQPGLDVPVGGEQERAGRPKSASLEQACTYILLNISPARDCPILQRLVRALHCLLSRTTLRLILPLQ